MTDWQTWALLDRVAKIEERLARIETVLTWIAEQMDDAEPGDMQDGDPEQAPSSLDG